MSVGLPRHTHPPRVGVVGAWIDPDDRRVWSGVPKGLMAALAELGHGGVYYDATPPRIPTAIARRLHRVRGGPEASWTLGPEMRFVTSLANLVHRVRTRGMADAWVNAAAGFGRPVGGRVAALVEISPSQLRWLNEHHPGASWPPLSPRRVDALCRQQLRLLRDAAVICTASAWARDSLVRDHDLDPSRIAVVGYGRNLELTPPEDKDWSTPRFLFVGRDWARKNGDAVVRAFREVRKLRPDARLDVEGGHPPLDEDGVVTHGRLDISDPGQRDLLESLFQAATCFVMPSAFEGFGIVHVEAAAAGVPSIGTVVGGTTDSIGSGGVCIDPSDDVALVDAMLQATDPDRVRSWGAEALARSGDYTWTKVASRVVQALEDREGCVDR